jgi:hypothetical protein
MKEKIMRIEVNHMKRIIAKLPGLGYWRRGWKPPLVMLSIGLLLILSPFLNREVYAQATVTYYFNGYDPAQAWPRDPGYMVDADEDSEARTDWLTASDVTQLNNTNTCPGTNLGTITKVEMRAMIDVYGTGYIYITPVFTGGTGTTRPFQNTYRSWTNWFEITSDPNAPGVGSWTWADVVNLDTTVRGVDPANQDERCYKIEIRVTYLGVTPLTFNSKYVVTSSTLVTSTSPTLADDTEASQNFYLAASQTVLVIYNPFNRHNGATEYQRGKQIAINVDGTDYANTWNSPYAANGANGATTFWIGTLAAGTHTIIGRFASNRDTSTVAINERVLLILILNGDAFRYVDDATAQSTTSTSLVNDPNASQTFTPSGNCQALILYNVGNSYGATEDQNGKVTAIRIGGTNNSQSEKAPYGTNYSDNVFTLHYAPLAATSYTAQGMFACHFNTVTISRRQFGILLFADTTLADYVTSSTAVQTTSAFPQDDDISTLISRTTTDTRELLVVAMGSKPYGNGVSVTGLAYGIKVDTNVRTKSRTSPLNLASVGNSASTAYAETLAAGTHTVRGQFGNNNGTDTARIESRRIVALWLTAPPPPTLLTFNSKYVKASTTPVQTTIDTLQDDTEASQTFSLTTSQTVLAIYQANNTNGAAMHYRGMQNAIRVDAMDYARSYDSPFDSNYCTRNTVFWIGTLASGSHTITGRFASNTEGSTATVNNRLLLIYILDGDAFLYLDERTLQETSSTVLVNDPSAPFTFTPSGSCKALILYNIANRVGGTEDVSGKKAAINISGTPYSQAEKAACDYNLSDSVFTAWAMSLSGFSTTVNGMFASNAGATVTIHRRQLGILMFADTTLLDPVSSDSQVSTNSSSLVDDTYATITRTTTDARELLVVAMATKRDGTDSNIYGERYGIKVKTLDRASSRGTPSYSPSAGVYNSSDSLGVAWSETLAAGSHTIQGRFSNNNNNELAVIDSRRIVALWFPYTPTAVRLEWFRARQRDDKVQLEWKTGHEVDNLGFHVYREENGQLVRLTPEPVAGSALMAGSRTALTAGHHYHWWDVGLSPQSSSLGTVRYWVKDIDLNGTHTWHGPVTPVLSREPLPEKFRPELLSEIGHRLQERYQHYWKVRELKEKLALKRLEVREAPRGRGLRSTSFEVKASNLKPLRPRPQTSSLDTETQQFLAGRAAVKLFVKEEGWYRVSQPELVAVGLSPRANPRYLQLYTEGKEQPIRLVGKKDGVFGPGDAIEFYGVGLDTPSTDTRVYWLIEGSRPGKRIQEFKGYSGSLSSSSFPYTVEKKDRTIYFSALRNGELENFFGPVVSSVPVDELLEVWHADAAAPGEALLEVSVQGVTDGPHRVKVLFNSDEVGEVVFEGQSRGMLGVEISHSEILEGENLVSLVAEGGETDMSLLDTIRLTYWHTYRADDNGLKFSASGGGNLSLSGFSNSRIRVFDITEPSDPIEVLGKVESEKGGYGISFKVPGTEQSTLLAMTEGKVKSPEEITPNHPSSWHQSREGYDLVMISHRDYLGSLEPLKKLRESQGLKVALIDVEDLYDEFSFGNKSPKAIKDFLTLAKSSWRKSPRYVLLVGDASFDPKNYLGLGEMDYVPTKLIDTGYMETASDDWFVDLNNDGLPEIAIGRLPVQTVEEAAIVVSKIVGYERLGALREALLVADMSERSGEFNFEGASEEVRALLPSSLMVRKIYRGEFSDDLQAKGELIRDINEGPLLVDYIGHGSVEFWRGDLFSSDDAEGLTNAYRLPLIVSMTCLNGYFQTPYGDTLAEALFKAKGGGAVAVWTSSGMTEPDKQAVMNKELIKLLFGRDSLTLGEAAARAKSSVSDQDVRKTWILFGDPTTRLK